MIRLTVQELPWSRAQSARGARWEHPNRRPNHPNYRSHRPTFIPSVFYLQLFNKSVSKAIIIITIIFDSDLESESRRIILNKSPKYLQLVIFPSFKIIFNNNRTSVDLQIESGPLSESQNI